MPLSAGLGRFLAAGEAAGLGAGASERGEPGVGETGAGETGAGEPRPLNEPEPGVPGGALGEPCSIIVPLNLGAARLAFWSKPHWLHFKAVSTFLVPQLGQNTVRYPPAQSRAQSGYTSLRAPRQVAASRNDASYFLR